MTKLISIAIVSAAASFGAAIQEAHATASPGSFPFYYQTIAPTTGSAVAGPILGNAGGSFASASPGVLRARAGATFTSTSGSSYANSSAQTSGTVTFTCTGLCGSAVSVALNLNVTGSLSANGRNDVNSQATASGYSRVNLDVTFNGVADSGQMTLNAPGSILPQNPLGPFSSPAVQTSTQTGMFSSYNSANPVATSATILVPLNTPIPLIIRLSTAASSSQWGNASADFSHTVTFPYSAVFNLPAGYSAYSTDFNIVDNLIPAPEPGTTALIGAGLIALAWRRRQRTV